jgi:hypothetical protein
VSIDLLAARGKGRGRVGDQRPILNRASPLAEALHGLWVPVAGGKLIANVITPGLDEPTILRAPTPIHSPDGLLACDNAAAGVGPCYSVTISDRLKIPGPLSLMWAGSALGAISGASRQVFSCAYNDTNGNPFVGWGFDRSTSAQVTASWNNAGTLVSRDATTGLAFPTAAYGETLALTLGSTGRTYHNGIPGATGGTAVTTINYTATSRLVLGPNGPASGGFSNTGLLVAGVWLRELKAEEVAQFHQDPTALLLEPWRAARFFTVPAGGVANVQTNTGSLTPTGTLVKATTKTVAGSSTPTSTLSKATSKGLAGSVTPVGALTLLRSFLRTFTGSVTPSGALSRAAAKVATGTITPVGVLAKATAKGVAGTITPTGRVVKATAKVLAGQIVPTSLVRKAIAKVLSGLLTPTGQVTSPSIAQPTDVDWQFHIVGFRWEDAELEGSRWTFPDGAIMRTTWNASLEEERWTFGSITRGVD